ncbi:MAG: acetyl-CoA carboxylase carboxyltransferase component [Methanobacteriota archaeon]|jgi:acetyl-CoA carboxylase carboxyltransferase component
MDVRLDDDASDDEVDAIATALAEHLDDRVNVYVGDDAEPTAVRDPPRVPNERYDDDAEPTEREERLRAEIEAIESGGPQKYREKLEEQGKLFVRDRLDLWFNDEDDDSALRFEDGRFANFDEWHESVEGSNPDDPLPADGLLTGAATFDGRDVHFMANDFSVKAGSMAEKGVEKFLRMQQRAVKNGKPVLYLMDSSGGRIDQQTGFFANREGIGKYYYNHSMLSGRVPQICVLYGPCIAGAAYTPVFADFTVMVEDMSAMAIASPRMVEMVTGEDIEMQDLGGASVHASESGSADLVARDERHARRLVSQLIEYLPDKAGEKPPRGEPRDPVKSPRGTDATIPSEPNKAYDVKELIDRVVDKGSFFELREEYGKEIVTAFARIDGRPVGIVANQPDERSGAIFPDSAEKAAEFIWTCDAYEIPLLYLCDTPGFMAGSDVEKDAILEKGKKFIYATSSATVPKLSVVVRKAYGAGIYAMSGPAYDPESTLALPSGEIAIMGPEAAINAVYARKLDEIDDEDERAEKEQELREEYREDIDVHRMASEVVIDEIVPPSELRDELVQRYDFYEGMEKELPDKKHGTVL